MECCATTGFFGGDGASSTTSDGTNVRGSGGNDARFGVADPGVTLLFSSPSESSVGNGNVAVVVIDIDDSGVMEISEVTPTGSLSSVAFFG